MKLIYILFVFSFCSIQAETRTEQFLQNYPIEEIWEVNDWRQNNFENPATHEDRLFIEEIIAKEDEQLVGYHGASQGVRLFQDILHLLFEELLEISLPENFYLFRAPGESYNSLDENYAYSFLTYREKIRFPKEHQEGLIEAFVLMRVNELFNGTLKAKEFSEEEQEVMTSLVYVWAEIEHGYYDALRYLSSFEPKERPDDAKVLAKIATILAPHFPRSQEVFLPILLIDLSWDGINSRPWMSEDTSPFTEFLSEGSFSTEGTTRGKYYHNYGREIENYQSPFEHIGDLGGGAREMVAMNSSIHANFRRSLEYSAFFYFNNASAEIGERYAISDLKTVGKKMGLSKELVEELWQAGVEILGDEKRGVIFQIFDRSEEPFALIDRSSYLSTPCGNPIQHAEEIPTSTLLSGEGPMSHFCSYPVTDDPEVLELFEKMPILADPNEEVQIRLLMNNQLTLNPNQPLEIRRYDRTSNEVKEKLQQGLREILQKANIDKSKAKEYAEEVKKSWEVVP